MSSQIRVALTVVFVLTSVGDVVINRQFLNFYVHYKKEPVACTAQTSNADTFRVKQQTLLTQALITLPALCT
jgi:hypothetical protein